MDTPVQAVPVEERSHIDTFSCPTDVTTSGPPARHIQVHSWNATGAVVAAFNLQGAAYDRTRRAFRVHDASPPELSAGVRVRDVPGLTERCSGRPVAAYCDARKVRAAAMLGRGAAVEEVVSADPGESKLADCAQGWDASRLQPGQMLRGCAGGR